MAIPLGIAFLVPRLPYLLIPSLVVYVAGRALRSYANIAVPAWLLFVTYIFSWPIALVAYARWLQWRLARKAAANGAVLMPLIESKDPFGLGLDIMRKVDRDRDRRCGGEQ